ncbi:uncharacterized protein At5g01610-like [Andrographis paniculata]|uniref:uncharacterized protein At5g01610-like n=1 Tax=Andrographis paniculata TaxID=175694 RepID=UPI0021E8F84F|nr:uncharacterized protein At5g01610-like [Andrographis paniculata]
MSLVTAFFLLIVPLAASVPEVVATDAPTVYQILQSYSFPVGLLPQGVTSYQLDADTGKFVVNLNGTCSFSVAGYDLKYKTKITGTISSGKIRNLTGIQVKVLFFWVNIIEVTSDGNNLELSVGIASAEFAVDNFNESPQCGCGFDCVSATPVTVSGGAFSF